MRSAIVFSVLLLTLRSPAFAKAPKCASAAQAAAGEVQIKTSTEELKRLIKLPDAVKSAQWQTGKMAAHGEDWWVMAILEVDSGKISTFLQAPSEKLLLESPPGLKLVSAFACLKSLPGASVTKFGQVRVVTDIHGVGSYSSSPLLHGHAFKLSDRQVAVYLWTN